MFPTEVGICSSPRDHEIRDDDSRQQEKFCYGATLVVLYSQQRLLASDLVLGGVDILFGMLFLLAFFRTSA